jgi:5-methyltetrahydrofolate--homocysteine methyltransferase
MSDNKKILKTLSESMTNLELEEVLEKVNTALGMQIPPQDIIKLGLSPGMEIIGEKFASGEAFLSELIFVGHIMKEAMAIIDPILATSAIPSEGKVVIATVEGDLHDIGKNIAISMLRSAGFEVIDLGVDVTANTVVEKASLFKADIVALSALLSVVEPFVEKTVRLLKGSEIRNKVKVMVGGSAMNDVIARKIGADAYAKDAWDGISKAKELMKSIKT